MAMNLNIYHRVKYARLSTFFLCRSVFRGAHRVRSLIMVTVWTPRGCCYINIWKKKTKKKTDAFAFVVSGQVETAAILGDACLLLFSSFSQVRGTHTACTCIDSY